MKKLSVLRVSYTLLSAVIIAGGSYLAIMYARGNFRFTRSGILPESGLLSVNSFPTGAQVYIDDKLTTATNDTVYLEPGKYQVRLIKDGYSPWQKELRVEKELVAQTNARLFPIASSLTPLTFTGVENLLPSPDGRKIVYFTASASAQTRNGLYILELNDSINPFARTSRQIAQDVPLYNLDQAIMIWSPDSSQLMVISELKQIVIDTNQVNNLLSLPDISFRRSQILSEWEEEMYLRERQYLAEFPVEVIEITTQSATCHNCMTYNTNFSSSISSPNGYTKDNTKPTLILKKASISGGTISSYSVSLDSGKNRGFSTTGIPATGNGTANYVWKDDSSVKVTFVNENDSDSSNDEIQVYFKGLDISELSEGKHIWTATAYDNLSTSSSESADFYIDKTTPTISELTIANVSAISSGDTYNLNVTNRMPSFSGLATDSYQGSTVTNSDGTNDTFDKASSGPQILTLTFKKQKGNQAYVDYSTKDFSLFDIQDTSGDNKSTRFYITTPFPLVDGYYQVAIVLKDSAGNIYTHPAFYLSINNNSSGQLKNPLNGNSDTRVINREEIPDKTEEEKQQIQENGYTIKIKVIDKQNKPIPGAKVTIHSKVQEALTNEDGVAEFKNVEAGAHKVLIAYNNFEGEQSVNLTGDVKEFDLNVTIQQKAISISPLAYGIIGIMGLVIIALAVLSIKLWKTKK